MKLNDYILLLIDLSEGGIRGKTLLQKRMYFLSILMNEDFGFKAHYYGPYSPYVEDALGTVKSLGFVEEHSTGYGLTNSEGFEVRRYDYSLTEDGKSIVAKYKHSDEIQNIENVLEKLKKAGDDGDYMSLSIAAKIHYILENSDKELYETEINDLAGKFGWNITLAQSAKAIQFLKNLELPGFSLWRK